MLFQLQAIVSEIDHLTNGMKELDKAVDAATSQRKAEHRMYADSLAENNAAVELLQMAYNRMAKFYNPKLAEAPAVALNQQDLVNDADLADSGAADDDDDDESSEAPDFVQVYQHSMSEDERTSERDSTSDEEETSDAQETGADQSESNTQTKPTEESGGVMHMLTLLKEEVQKSIVMTEVEETDAQKDYEVFMKDSTDKRAVDSKAVANAESVKAKVETEIQKAKVKLDEKTESLEESKKELVDLHYDCDWFLQNFDARKSARDDESDALTKARAVLSGADYS
jgi:hypothetical protein